MVNTIPDLTDKDIIDSFINGVCNATHSATISIVELISLNQLMIVLKKATHYVRMIRKYEIDKGFFSSCVPYDKP